MIAWWYCGTMSRFYHCSVPLPIFPTGCRGLTHGHFDYPGSPTRCLLFLIAGLLARVKLLECRYHRVPMMERDCLDRHGNVGACAEQPKESTIQT